MTAVRHWLVDQIASLVPLASCLLLLVVDLAPLPVLGRSPTFLLFAGAAFWSLRQPAWFTPGAAFVAGLVADILAGLPPGATALALLISRQMLAASHAHGVVSSGWAAWGLVALVAVLATGVRWAVIGAWLGRAAPPEALLTPLLLTAGLYPVVAAFLEPVDRALQRVRHAA